MFFESCRTFTPDNVIGRAKRFDKRVGIELGVLRSHRLNCLGLNSRNRLIVAHALWTAGGASHVSRSKRTVHFSDLNDVSAETKKAQALMNRMFFEKI